MSSKKRQRSGDAPGSQPGSMKRTHKPTGKARKAAAEPKKTNNTQDLPIALVPKTNAVVQDPLEANQNSLSTFPITETSVAYYASVLNAPLAIANSSSSRIGRSVKMSAVAIRGNISLPTTRPAHGLIFRMYLVYWKNISFNAATEGCPKGSDFVKDVLGAGAVPNPHSHSRPANVSDFRLLKTWTYTMAASSTWGHPVFFDEYINLKGKETSFKRDDATGSFGAMTKGALVLYTSCARTAEDSTDPGPALLVGSECPSFTGISRLYFEG